MRVHSYKILRERKMIVWVIGGQIIMSDLCSKIDTSLFEENDIPAYSALIDMRDAEFKFNKNALIQCMAVIRDHSNLHKIKSVVFITNTPDQVVMCTMIKSIYNSAYPNIKIVSTLDAGLDYLSLTTGDVSYFDELLQEMKIAG